MNLTLGNRNKDLRVLIIALTFALLLLSNYIGFVRSGLQSVNDFLAPIHRASNRSGSDLHEQFKLIGSIGDLRHDNNELRVKNAQLEANQELIYYLNNENDILLREMKMGRRGVDKVAAEVLTSQVNGMRDILIINVGEDEGVSQGDIVSVGNIFIGIVGEVSEHSSIVMLPNRNDSFIEVRLIPKFDSEMGVEDLGQMLRAEDHIPGIAVGESRRIRVENVDIEYEVKRGMGVVTYDEKVLEFLYIGRVSDVEADPTQSQQSLYVEPPLNYSELSYVIVNKK